MSPTINSLVLQFTGLFLFMLIPGYLMPAGWYYWMYHVRQSKANEPFRIQDRRATPGQIAREVKLSILTVFIFSLMATVLLQMYLAGRTNIYWRFREYGWLYLPVSVFLCMVIHDTYFYWTHRLMHWRPLFKYTHVGHHRSISPTPWAIYAFQPAEAIIQFLGIMAIVIFLPLHPVALLAFLWADTQMNTAGHTGFEIVPRFISQHPLYQGFNTVTHHDAHHTNMGKNFGSFFNVWDRWMGTFQDGVTPPDPVPESTPEPAVGVAAAPHRRRRTRSPFGSLRALWGNQSQTPGGVARRQELPRR